MKIGKKTKIGLLTVVITILLGFTLPENIVIPIQGASSKDWNHQTFWYEPWGKSGVHKGIDIFSPAGRSVISTSSGLVLFAGNIRVGGNVVLVLGPKWRIHYYAHLKDISTSSGSWVVTSDIIGTVGTSGNARGKPPHLHYAILTLVPYLTRWDSSTQGWKKIFYLNPSQKLLQR